MDTRKRQKVLQERQDTEYNRSVQQRDAIDAIGKDAQATFDNQVRAGAMTPEDFDSFWNKYTVPKLKQQYLLNGDINKAESVQKWGDSEEAREGGRLFTSSLLKAQTGDAAGALDDAMKLGKLKGYMSHGYEVLGQESIEGGFNIKMKTPDGKEITQSVLTEDLPRLIATFGNPQAAMESQVAARAEQAAADREVDTHRRKKAADKEFGLGGGNGGKLRADAITALRKRFDGGLTGDEAKFDHMPRDEQEKLIQQESDLVSGQPGVAPAGGMSIPQRKALVDTTTGKVVDTAALGGQQRENPQGTVSQTPASTAGATEETVQRAQVEREPTRSWKNAFGDAARAVFGEPAPRDAGNGTFGKAQQGPVDGRSAAQRSMSEMMRRAEAALLDGHPVDRIEKGLASSGISAEQWPASLRQAISEAKQKAIGLAGR